MHGPDPSLKGEGSFVTIIILMQKYFCKTQNNN